MLAAALLAFFAASAPAAEDASAPRAAVGANVLGGQVSYDLTKAWRGELRYVTGRQSSASGTISSSVIGLRGYRLFGAGGTRFYGGAEFAYASARQTGTGYKVSGPAAGGFVGVERRIVGGLWAGLDAGPYLFSLRESNTRASDTSFDFILNSYVSFYVF